MVIEYIALGVQIISLFPTLYNFSKEIYSDLRTSRSRKYLNPDTIAALYSELKNAPESERPRIIYRNRELLYGAATMARDVVKDNPELRERGYDIYLKLDELVTRSIQSQKPEQKKQEEGEDSAKKATVVASLIVGSLALTYFSLFPTEKTIHAVVLDTLDVSGIFLSFLLICIGLWVTIKRKK